MSFMAQCVQDSLPIWEDCLNTEFLRKMEDNSLDMACFNGYIVDDSLYLREYAKVFAWGIVNAKTLAEIRTYYSFLSFVNEGEGTTRVDYLLKMGLSDEAIEGMPRRPQNVAYTDFMLEAAREGEGPECMMALMPCMLSYAWIFHLMLERTPALRDSCFWPLIRDYTSEDYDQACREWSEYTNQICAGLPPERLERCMELFRTSSRMELGFWQMSQTPRTDLPIL